jgi:hypothetical protein
MLLQKCDLKQTSTDELLQNTCSSGEVDHLNQHPKFSLGSTGTDHNIARDVVQVTDNMSASCVIADGYVIKLHYLLRCLGLNQLHFMVLWNSH